LKEPSTISIGSSSVHTLTSGVARFFSVEYRVTVLPLPVGPVTRMMPLGWADISSMRRLLAAKPSSEKSRTSTSGSKIRITSFSPKAVGSVDRRSSTSWPVLRARLDPAVLRAALLDHVHAAEHLDAAGHGVEHRHRDLVHLMQHAVDAEAHDAQVAPRLDVDVRGALLEGILPEPIDDAHDVLVVGVELLVALAQLDQLLEVRGAAGNIALVQRALDELGQVVELHLVARMSSGLAMTRRMSLRRIGRISASQARWKGSAVAITTSLGLDLHRQDAEARRVGAAHHPGHRRQLIFSGSMCR
jgi:hypothetical protein